MTKTTIDPNREMKLSKSLVYVAKGYENLTSTEQMHVSSLLIEGYVCFVNGALAIPASRSK